MAEENDGADAAVRLLLLELGVEAIAAGGTVQAEGSGIVGNGIPVWVDQDKRGGDVVKKLSDDGFHGSGQDELDSLFEKGVDGVEPGGHVGDERSVTAYAAEEGSELFGVGGHWPFGEGGDLVGVRLTPAEEIVCLGKSALVAPSLALAGKPFRLCLRRRWDRARISSTREAGSGSKTMTLSR